MYGFDPNNVVDYLKLPRPASGSVSLFFDGELNSVKVQQSLLLCRDLVATREFVQKLEETDRRKNEIVYIGWDIANVQFHLGFDRDHLVKSASSNGASIHIDNVKLHAFKGALRYEVILETSKRRQFIVFRQHLQHIPPVLYHAASELRPS